jgi:hypothetical protein
MKVQNIYIKPLLKPKNTCNKPYFETAYLGKNVKKWPKQKVAQNVTIFGLLHLLKKLQLTSKGPKVAQLVKNRPVWSP